MLACALCACVFVQGTTGLNLVCNITAAMWAGVCSPHACKSGVLACATPCVHGLVHVTTVLKVVRTCWPLGRAYPDCHERTCGSEKQQRSSWFASVHWRWKKPQSSSFEQALVAHLLRVRLLAKVSEVHVPARVKVGHNARWQGRRAKRRRCFAGHRDLHVARPASCPGFYPGFESLPPCLSWHFSRQVHDLLCVERLFPGSADLNDIHGWPLGTSGNSALS